MQMRRLEKSTQGDQIFPIKYDMIYITNSILKTLPNVSEYFLLYIEVFLTLDLMENYKIVKAIDILSTPFSFEY